MRQKTFKEYSISKGMPPLETLADITHITFPQKLDHDGVINYFAFLCKEVPCSITGKFGQFVNIGSRFSLEEKFKEVPVEYGAAECSGSLTKIKDGSRSTLFNLTRKDCESLRRFTGMYFFTTPGYELEELDPKEVQLYRDLQRLTQEYFRQGCPEVSKRLVPED